MAIKQAVHGTPRAALGAAFQEYEPDLSRFIATQVLPLARTSEKAATFSAITRESMMIRADAVRASGGNYNRIDVYSEDKTFACEERGLEGRLPDDQRIFYRSDYDAEQATADHIMQQLMQELEIDVATLILNATTWAGAALFKDVSAAPWSTAASDIIGPIIDAIEACRKNTGVMPDTLVIGAETFANMLKNTGIKAQFPGAPLITQEMVKAALAPIFGLDQILIGRGRYNTSDEGIAFVGADIWEKKYAMVMKAARENDPISTPCVGRTFLWESDSADLATVEEYREDKTRSDVFRVRHWKDDTVIDKYFGFLLQVEA